MPTSGLTPRQHRLIRTQLALIPSCVWAVHLWLLFWQQLPRPGNAERAHLVRDFLHFYTQGVIARLHDTHALYDIAAMAGVAARAMPETTQMFPPVYGPQVALLFRPLASLSYLSALYVWLAFTIVGTSVCLAVTWRRCPEPRPSAWVIAVLALGLPGLHFTLSFGQASVVGVAALTAIWLALRADRMFLAGLAVGLLAYKPQLGIVAAAVFVLRGEWNVVAGALASVAGQALVAAEYWGASVFSGYAHALRQLPHVFTAMEPDPQLSYSMRAVLVGLGLSPTTALVLSAGLSVVVVVAVVRSWHPDLPVERQYSGLIFATLLIDPHLYAYDLLLAAPAMTVATTLAWSRNQPISLWAIGVLYIAPILAALLPRPAVAIPVALAINLVLTLGLDSVNNVQVR